MKNALAFALICIVLSACSSSDPAAPVPTGVKVPGVGSTFEFSLYATGLDGKKIPGTDSTFVQTVIASGGAFGTKTGVWSIESKDAVSGEPSDTVHLCLDDRQDVLMFFPDLSADGSPRWIRLPITTGVAFTDSTTTTETLNGLPLELKLKVTTERLADESIAVGTSSVAAKKVSLTVMLDIKSMGQSISAFEQKGIIWFAPSLGIFAQRSSDAVNFGGDVLNGEYVRLTKYTLK